MDKNRFHHGMSGGRIKINKYYFYHHNKQSLFYKKTVSFPSNVLVSRVQCGICVIITFYFRGSSPVTSKYSQLTSLSVETGKMGFEKITNVLLLRLRISLPFLNASCRCSFLMLLLHSLFLTFPFVFPPLFDLISFVLWMLQCRWVAARCGDINSCISRRK